MSIFLNIVYMKSSTASKLLSQAFTANLKRSWLLFCAGSSISTANYAGRGNLWISQIITSTYSYFRNNKKENEKWMKKWKSSIGDTETFFQMRTIKYLEKSLPWWLRKLLFKTTKLFNGIHTMFLVVLKS